MRGLLGHSSASCCEVSVPTRCPFLNWLVCHCCLVARPSERPLQPHSWIPACGPGAGARTDCLRHGAPFLGGRFLGWNSGSRSVYPVGTFQGHFLILRPPSFWRKSKARVSCLSLSFSGLDMVCIAWSLSSVLNPNIIFYQVWVFPPRYFLKCSGWWFGACMC